MHYLVEMRIVDQLRATTPKEGIAFIEQIVLPTLALCNKLRDEKKILAGGPMSGTIGLALLMDVGSPLELDEILISLPLWSRMTTHVTPLTTFDDRGRALQAQIERLKALL